MCHIIMDALYDFLPVPSANAEDTTPRLYPKIVSKGTVTFEKLTEQIANHSGLTKGTILAVMDEIEYWTAQYLSDGYRVQIGNIGTASVSLKANTEVYDPSDVHAQSIRFGKVRLTLRRNSPSNARETYSVRLPERKSYGIPRYIRKKKGCSSSSRIWKPRYITLKAYGELAGLPKTTAWRDLNKWTEAHLIGIEGRAPHRVYVKLP